MAGFCIFDLIPLQVRVLQLLAGAERPDAVRDGV